MTKQLPHQLLRDVLAAARPPAAVRLSVIGLCKNAGKTVTLNHLIRAAAEQNLPLGLISTGRDGEEQDAVTELPKPRIWAPAGALVATTVAALDAGTAGIRVLEQLPMATPFGPVVTGRVEAAGEVLLIGPGSAGRVGAILERLEAQGARLSLVDGSFDRIAAAAPAVTGNVILAAGAAYSHSMAVTVAQVRHLLDLFDLPRAPLAPELVDEALRLAPVCLVSPGKPASQAALHPLPVAGVLGDPEPLLAAVDAAGQGHGVQPEGQAPGPPLLALRGALGDRLITALLHHQQPLDLVVRDPTHVLVERNLWRRWRRKGGRAYVHRPARLVAVTTNAYSPVGKGYDPSAFFEAVSDVAGRPVYDLEAGYPRPTT